MRLVSSSFAALALLVAAGAAAADEGGDDSLAVPLVVVEAGGSVSTRVLSSVAAGIGAPLLRGEELRRRMPLAAAEEPGGSGHLEKRGRRAADLFFAGEHEAARVEFEDLLAGLEGRPELFARDPGLRKVAFDARMFLASIARLRGQERLIDELLAEARGRYPELEPGSADFPPWLRERHAGAEPLATGDGEPITLESPEGCELIVDGRPAPAADARPVRLERGVHAIRTRCQGRLGPIVVLRREAAPARFRPPVFAAARLTSESSEVVLVADADAGDEDLVSDMLELARLGDFERIAVVVGRERGIDLWLLDVEAAGPTRTTTVLRPAFVRGESSGEPPPDELERAGAVLAGRVEGAGVRRSGARPGPWYRDGLAWGVAAAGLVAVGAGAALAGVHGGPSEHEPVAFALIAAGAALGGTGVALFLVPAAFASGGKERGGTAALAGASFSF